MNFSKMRFWGNDIIKFYCEPRMFGTIPEPRPAAKNLPNWFKNLEPQYKPKDNTPELPEDRDIFGNPLMSAKMCLPLLDAMSFGFTIPLAGDVRVITNHNNTKFKVSHGQIHIVDFHSSKQVGGDFNIKKNQGTILKFINPWVIKTAPGWSSLFIPPLNHFETPFTALSAMVDTDVYWKQVHFPVIWNLRDADITLPAGTPLVTVIPIKRNSFPRKPIITKPTKEEEKFVDDVNKIQGHRSHYYTYELRKKR